MAYPKIASFKTPQALREYLSSLSLHLELDDQVLAAPDSPLAQPLRMRTAARAIGNRFAILPMEGWDGTPDGRPTPHTIRRWRHFGESGAKLIWGGEAVAVRHDGRANPNQLLINEHTLKALDDLRQQLVHAHEQDCAPPGDLVIGLQLTHSGRYARPNVKSRPEPMILYHHPLLDRRVGVDASYPVMTDAQIDDLIGEFVRAAAQAREIGFDFVDVKHCHGYLGHEFLSAVDRPGRYGGSFENRTRFLRDVVAGIRRDAPGLDIGVRLSAFDLIAFRKGADGIGTPEPWDGDYPYAFGCNPAAPTQLDLAGAVAFLDQLRRLSIQLVCITAGSPYYNPHIQRPAAFPPSDGYLPPEDPLAGVARQICAVAALKRQFPDLILVGSGYTYLQDYLPHVAQAQVRLGHVDLVGLGRMVLACPTLPSDVLAGRPVDARRLCRTFSDCTTAPRAGLVSGCYPLDPYYKNLPEHDLLKAAKK